MQVEKLLSSVIYVGVLGIVYVSFLREISMEKACICRSICLPRRDLLSPASLRDGVPWMGLEKVNNIASK